MSHSVTGDASEAQFRDSASALRARLQHLAAEPWLVAIMADHPALRIETENLDDLLADLESDPANLFLAGSTTPKAPTPAALAPVATTPTPAAPTPIPTPAVAPAPASATPAAGSRGSRRIKPTPRVAPRRVESPEVAEVEILSEGEEEADAIGEMDEDDEMDEVDEGEEVDEIDESSSVATRSGKKGGRKPVNSVAPDGTRLPLTRKTVNIFMEHVPRGATVLARITQVNQMVGGRMFSPTRADILPSAEIAKYWPPHGSVW